MAWKKLTALTAETAPGLNDIIYMVKDPTGTPLDRKVTFQSFRDIISPAGRTVTNPLTGTLTLSDTDMREQYVVPDANRTIVLPAESTSNHEFYILNGCAFTDQYMITVQDDGGAIIAVVTPRSGVTVWSSGIAWFAEGSPAYKQIWIPAGVLKPRLTTGCNDIAVYETATNYQNFDYNLFPDASGTYGVYSIVLPQDYIPSTSLYAMLYYGFASAASTTDSYWLYRMYGYGNNINLEQAFTSTRYQTVSATATTANRMCKSAMSGSITIDGSALPGDYVNIQLQRLPASASDTCAVDIRVFGIMLWYRAGKS